MVAKALLCKVSERPVITRMSGHSLMKAWELISPGTDGSLHLRILLDEFEPGGGIDRHYHDCVPACDHAYYVISGEILATLNDREEVVGPGTLIYCLSDQLHALKNVGKTPAMLLKIGAVPADDRRGKAVYVKKEMKK